MPRRLGIVKFSGNILAHPHQNQTFALLRHMVINRFQYLHRQHPVADFIQNRHHPLQRFTAIVIEQAAHIFTHANGRHNLLHHAGKLIKQSTAGIGQAQFFTGIAECLARKAAGHHIGGVFKAAKVKLGNIAFQNPPMRPVLTQGGTGPFVDFIECHTLQARLFQAHRQATGTGKQLQHTVIALRHHFVHRIQ